MLANNTILAVAVGAGLVGFSLFLYRLVRGRTLDSEGWAAFFGVTGMIATAIGLHTTLTWPYGTTDFAYANIEFGEPGLAFGVLLLVSAVYLWRNRFAGASQVSRAHLVAGLKPISIFVFFMGLSLAFLALAWVRFQMGAAPEIEPISGNFGKWPWLEATFLGGLWGLVALGALLFPLALSKLRRSKLMLFVISVWMIAGIVFGVFGAMNMYTHIGMYYNAAHHTEHKW